MSNFTKKFILNCAKNGFNTKQEIAEQAQANIERINKVLKSFHKLKELKQNYISVLDYLNVDKNESELINDFSIPANKLPSSLKKICIDICQLIEEPGEGLKNRDIMNALAPKDPYKSTKIYHCILWLEEHNIIKRIEKDFVRYVYKGDKWLSKGNLEIH